MDSGVCMDSVQIKLPEDPLYDRKVSVNCDKYVCDGGDRDGRKKIRAIKTPVSPPSVLVVCARFRLSNRRYSCCERQRQPPTQSNTIS